MRFEIVEEFTAPSADFRRAFVCFSLHNMMMRCVGLGEAPCHTPYLFFIRFGKQTEPSGQV